MLPIFLDLHDMEANTGVICGRVGWNADFATSISLNELNDEFHIVFGYVENVLRILKEGVMVWTASCGVGSCPLAQEKGFSPGLAK